ncbi:MAG TPA: tripartite tricarboxylate transporter substrate binding protein [Xanthobacteraceae bacterium]|jgi:tripartite-type tricarboxylate transporter receptor subunit TctC|nr:tripartite tricarboxylate transporter substrate binding protein [Xanthobacteraceae bacterium]
MLHRAVLVGFWACALGAVLTCASAQPAAAQASLSGYPTRPITLIVPYPAGGGVDVMGRMVGQKLSVALGQQVVIENRGGAGGMIGTRDAARATPDGYTLVMLLTGISLGADPGYDVNKDFAPVGLVASTPIIVVTHPSVPAKSLTDIIALAKKEPGKYSAGTPPAPTVNYFAAELFNVMAGTQITVVTYKGTGPLTNDLLGGHVQLGFNTIPASVSNIAAGALHGIAVAAATRSAALPNVPTAAESGLPGFEAVQYYGLAAPAGTPRPIVERLNKELRAILATDDMKKLLRDAGSDPTPSTPEEYAANIKHEEGKWADLVKKLGLKLE